mgnify:CR=1 FL=1
MDELKPCPFCGGEANINHGNGIFKRFYVYCVKCKARHPNRLTRECAIDYWNRRFNNG